MPNPRYPSRTPATSRNARSIEGIRLPGAGLIFSSGNGRKWTEPSGKLLHDEVVPAQICRHRSVGLCGCEEAGNEGHGGDSPAGGPAQSMSRLRAPMADSQSHCRQGSLSARHRQRRSVRLVRSRSAGSGGSAAHPGPPPRWTGQIRPLVDTANPAISGVPRRELSSTSRRPVLARWSGPWCASCEGRTSARARDGAGDRAAP